MKKEIELQLHCDEKIVLTERNEEMLKYCYGQIPHEGDVIQSINHDEEIDVKESVDSINEDGTININISGMGIIHGINPSEYVLLNNNWESFWDTVAKSKEEDILECEACYGEIINNGDYTFMWKDSWKPVTLSGEFLGMKWRIKTR